jgi:hypothetical protein
MSCLTFSPQATSASVTQAAALATLRFLPSGVRCS